MTDEFLTDQSTTIENPLTVDPAFNYDPTVQPAYPTPIPTPSPEAAYEIARQRIAQLWQQNQAPAGRNPVWPLVVVGVVIGLLINRRS